MVIFPIILGVKAYMEKNINIKEYVQNIITPM